MKSKLIMGMMLTLLSMSILATEHVLSKQIGITGMAIKSSSETVTLRMYAVKDADDRPTGTDVELRIGREWGSTECWLQFDLNSIARYSSVDNVTFCFYHARTTYQENAIRMMGNDDWDWTEDGVDKPDGNWSTHALGWYDYGDAQMPPKWMGWNDTQTAKMGLDYPFLYGPVTGHLTEYVNEILTHENRNLTLVLKNIWGDGAGGSHYHASRESGHVPYLEFAYDLYTLNINSAIGGTTNPLAGSYTYGENEIATVTAIPDIGYHFDHWEYNGQTIAENPISIIMNQTYTLTPSFSPAPPSVGGKATPIVIPVNKHELLATYIALIATIILAVSISVAYVKYRKKQ